MTENVATVLEQELMTTIDRWVQRVYRIPSLRSIPLTYHERTGHLPHLLKDLITSLRGEDGPPTTSAYYHGEVRFEQGYSVEMLVEESRLLKISILETLRLHQASLQPAMIVKDVMTISCGCDRQLRHATETFMNLDRCSTWRRSTCSNWRLHHRTPLHWGGKRVLKNPTADYDGQDDRKLLKIERSHKKVEHGTGGGDCGGG
jgi:hypothetical protein